MTRRERRVQRRDEEASRTIDLMYRLTSGTVWVDGRPFRIREARAGDEGLDHRGRFIQFRHGTQDPVLVLQRAA